MKHLKFTVSEAIGGYTINVLEDLTEIRPGEIDYALGDCHVATSREGVGKVVTKLCDEAFTAKTKKRKKTPTEKALIPEQV